MGLCALPLWSVGQLQRQGGLGSKVTLRQAIEHALPFVAKGFPDQPLIEARLRLTLGASFAYLGEWRKAEEQYAAARALYLQHRGPDHPDTLMSMHNLAETTRALAASTTPAGLMPKYRIPRLIASPPRTTL